MYLKEISATGFKSFADKLTISLDGKTTCIVGPNGSGKTTLINYILNNNCMGPNVKYGYIEQVINFQDENKTVLEETRKYYNGDESHLRSALCKFLFYGENVFKKIKSLSGGEKVRLKLFCLMQSECNLLIFD